MSSYRADVVSATAAPISITYGWDAPLSTFYAVVATALGDELAYVGGTPHEVRTPQQLAQTLHGHYTLTSSDVCRLAADQRREGARFAQRPAAAFVGEAALATVVDVDQAALIMRDLRICP